MISIAPNLNLPLEAVTQTTGIIGIRGSGKTHTAAVFAEGLIGSGQQVIIFDPTDAWWGLRSSRDGKSVGYPVVVLGGNHADLPLEESAGAALADFVLNERAPIILSMRHMTQGEQRRLVTDFCGRLWRRKADADKHDPLAIIFDEASLFVPQRVGPKDAEMVGMIQRIVRQGRNTGFGVTLIDQRPASVNKDVLSQVELLICHRVIGKHDRDALKDWVEAHDTEGRGKEFMASLASLAKGEAWVWSPGWLDLFQRVQVRERRSFDSSATPKPGERVITPQSVAAVDIDALKQSLVSSIERAKADDPRELRRRIADLEHDLRSKRGPAIEDQQLIQDQVEAAEKRGRAAGIKACWEALEPLRAAVEKFRWEVVPLILTLDGFGLELPEAKGGPVSDYHGKQRPHQPQPVEKTVFSPGRSTTVSHNPSPSDNGIGKCEREILAVLAQHGPSTANRLALLSGYRYSGGFRNALGALRAAGFMTGQNTGSMSITAEGRKHAPATAPLRNPSDRINYWINHPSLGKAERAALQVLINAPRPLTGPEVAQKAGYEYSGGFRNALGALRTAGLIGGKSNTAPIAPVRELFE